MTTLPRSAFSVLTLNLRFGLADDGRHAWVQRRGALGAFLETRNCDVMMFQEANDFQIDFLSTCLRDYDVIGKRSPAPDFWQNNVIFYRAPLKLDTWRHFYLSPTPDIPSRFAHSRWPRQCTLGRFRTGPHEVVCGTTHLDFAESVQVASAAIIIEGIGQMAGERPVILGGDFNCTPTSACHAVFTRSSKPSDNATRDGRFRNVLKAPFPGTFHGFEGGAGHQCIDWILYRGAVSAHQGQVIHYPATACYPSDHYPVTANFVVGS